MQLLHTLSVWLSDAQCPHYFINNSNLTENSVHVKPITGQLNPVDNTWLSAWFLNSYIEKCFMHCPENVSSLFSNVRTSTELRNAISCLVNWRIHTALKEMWNTLIFSQFIIICKLPLVPLTAQSCMCLMTKLAKIDIHQ